MRLQYDVPQWAYFKRCAALAKYAPPDFAVDTGAWHPCVSIDSWPAGARYDLIMQLVPDHDRVRAELDARGMHDTLIVGGLNVGFGHHIERLRMQAGADHVVINNRDC
ncbi:MAG TPA: hypothetical protein VM118_09915, partial [Acidobacteriota bacterium]|nr:hypothetical protein [Acidobacteriota bacterium]